MKNEKNPMRNANCELPPTSCSPRSTLHSPLISRRQLLARMGAGFGTMGLATVLAEAGLLGGGSVEAAASSASPLAPKSPHFAPRAKNVIFLFMNGGPSHVD